MKNKVLLAIAMLLIVSLACSIDIGNTPQAPISEPQQQVVVVITATPGPDTIAPLPTYTIAPTYTLQPTYTPQPTNTPMPQVSQDPYAKATQDLNCRTGPSIEYPQIEALMTGKSAPIVGENDDNGIWYQVEISKRKCFVSAYYTTTVGNMGNIPYVVAPPLPTPVPLDKYVWFGLSNIGTASVCEVQVFRDNVIYGQYTWKKEEFGPDMFMWLDIPPGYYDYVVVYSCNGKEYARISDVLFKGLGEWYVIP